MAVRYLIMDIREEQGGDRNTQVQPPLGVWSSYFQVDLNDPPELSLINNTGATPEELERPIVRHDHNWTIELRDAATGGILLMEHLSENRYQYKVYFHTDPEHEKLDWMLDSFENNMRSSKTLRRWLIL